ncbi:SDR family NAD(P)-dependent oxidoreductase [Rubrobacter aplysinae]|uniref:SDR family NAD(P)-dependent oxidoreductase n=1 Tax=Rubrobacter aplysinae TaxID=909625 RepID=UPI00064BAB71
MQRYPFAGGTCVLTGAASGIGEAMAHGLAARGSHLVLMDRDAERLETVAGEIRSSYPGLGVATYVVDLAEADAAKAAAGRIRRETPRITLLINNAGVALGGRFDQVTPEEFNWVMNVNLRAPVLLTHHLLPALKESPGSHVVNVSSLFGLIAPAGQSAYSASKFALRGFSEALRHELVPDGIGVTTVHPGGVRTRIAETARSGSGVSTESRLAQKEEFDRLLTFPADRAAEIILDAVHHRKSRVLIGASAVLPDIAARLFPGSYTRALAILTKLLGRLPANRPAKRSRR